MALTRLRALAGDAALGERIATIAEQVIQSGDPAARTEAILDMRARLYRDKPATGRWDLKMCDGGLVDLEFVIQHAILTATRPQALRPELSRALEQLSDTGEWTGETSRTLSTAFTFLQALQQVQRIAHEGSISEQDLSTGLKDRLCRAVDSPDFDSLSEQLQTTCASVTAIFRKKLGTPATD